MAPNVKISYFKKQRRQISRPPSAIYDPPFSLILFTSLLNCFPLPIHDTAKQKKNKKKPTSEAVVGVSANSISL